VWLSHGSIWEIAIEHALARTDMPLSAAQAISWAEEASFALLPHRDPFDRLLVALGITESLTLLSADAALLAYRCPLQDARR